MVSGFLMDVLEVVSVKGRKLATGQMVTYATFSCPDCRFNVKLRDGLVIPEGWSGRIAGTCQMQNLYYKDFQGNLHERQALLPFEVTDWIPGQQLRRGPVSILNEFKSSLK